MRRAGFALITVLAPLAWAGGAIAHKGVTSRFTYNAEVYPIFAERCGHCHVAGGVGPMSLVTYQDAFPWAESLRAELLATEGSGSDENSTANFVRAAHRDLPARELDIILDWATGGTPEGDPAKAPMPVVLKNDWTHGDPPLQLPLSEPYEMPADLMETSQEFVIPIRVAEPRDANAVDVLPGNPAIVREVTLSLKSPDGQRRSLGTWWPRQNPAPLVVNPPARFAAGAELIVRIHYKKTWKYEGQPLTDRSTIGVYFTP